MLVKKEPKMRAPMERLLEINLDPATRALYDAREKERRDSRARERLAMQKGKAESMAQVTQRMKAMGFSDEQIQLVVISNQ